MHTQEPHLQVRLWELPESGHRHQWNRTFRQSNLYWRASALQRNMLSQCWRLITLLPQYYWWYPAVHNQSQQHILCTRDITYIRGAKWTQFVASVSATREDCCACVFDAASRRSLCPVFVIILRGRHNCWRGFWANLPLAFHGFLSSKGCWQCERVLGSSLRGATGLHEYDAESRGNRFPTFRINVPQISHNIGNWLPSVISQRGTEFSLLANKSFILCVSNFFFSNINEILVM